MVDGLSYSGDISALVILYWSLSCWGAGTKVYIYIFFYSKSPLLLQYHFCFFLDVFYFLMYLVPAFFLYAISHSQDKVYALNLKITPVARIVWVLSGEKRLSWVAVLSQRTVLCTVAHIYVKIRWSCLKILFILWLVLWVHYLAVSLSGNT